MCVYTCRPEESTRSHLDSCESPCDCWELNSGLLEEQQVLLTSEPSLQPHAQDLFTKKKNHLSRWWQCTALILALQRHRQVNLSEFEVNLVYKSVFQDSQGYRHVSEEEGGRGRRGRLGPSVKTLV